MAISTGPDLSWPGPTVPQARPAAARRIGILRASMPFSIGQLVSE
jgi:hypothetical protein